MALIDLTGTNTRQAQITSERKKPHIRSVLGNTGGGGTPPPKNTGILYP